MRKKLFDIYWIITALFMLLKLCLHFFTNTNYELHRDEMLYFNMADHLDFGYATVPPVIGLLAFITKNVFGYSVFGIRFFPAVLGAASVFIIAKTIKELGGGILALIIAAVSFVLSPGFLLFDTLFTPNVVEQFLWLLITYLIFRLTQTENPKLWIWIGVLMALSFLNKYSVLLLAAGFFVAVMFSRHRKLMNSVYFALAILLGLSIVSPNIIWQYQHNWPVVFHMSELQKTQLMNMTYVNYIIDIFSLSFVAIVVWLSGLLSLLAMKQEKSLQYIGVASVIIILLFLFSNAKGYYILGLLPFLLAIGGYAMEKYLRQKLRYINYGVVLVIIIFSFLSLPFCLPILPFETLSMYQEKTKNFAAYPFFRWEDGKVHNISQLYSDMTGWSELAGYVAAAYNQLSKEEQLKCTIYGERNYAYAGAVNFYGHKYHLPPAITFLESYVLWAPDTIPGGPFIYINSDAGDMNQLFTDIKEIGSVKNKYFREDGLKVFLCKSPKLNVAAVYQKKAKEEKDIYR